MSDLRIWEIEAGGLLQIQGKSGIQHETPFQNTKILIIIRIIKSMFTKTAKKTNVNLWILFPIHMGYILKKKKEKEWNVAE